MEISALQKARYEYQPKLPANLSGPVTDIAVESGANTEAEADREELKKIFPLTYGKPLVTFSGGKNEKTTGTCCSFIATSSHCFTKNSVFDR